MPPKPLGDRTMTDPERQAKHRARCRGYRTALERVLQAGRLSEARQIAAEALGASGVVRKGNEG